MEKVSVIVAVYNAERALEKTLMCIANQTFTNLEIILVDDGSTDSSGSICDAFAARDNRCKVIHRQNGGQGVAKNAGKAVATGKYLFFPDSDDTFNLDMIRLLYEAISKSPEYDIAICGRTIAQDWDNDITPSGVSCEDIESTVYSKDDLIEGLFAKGDECMIYCWNKLYRKELLEDVWCGDYARHHDFDFNFRTFLRTRKAVFVDIPLYQWVQWSGSKTHQSDTWDKHFKCRSEILYNNWKQLSPENAQYERYLLDALYRNLVGGEEWCRKSGNFTEVRAICKGYVKQSLNAYLKNIGIPFYKKIICLTLLAFPGFSHLIMRLTHNAR